MEYITLKNTSLRVSRLCMGGCPLGRYGWGDVQEKDLVDAVHAAWDQGIHFFDTADTYGLGTSERILGNALGHRRDRAVIATKFGVRVENGRTFYDNSPGWIHTACDNSLRRLGTDYIDLYQIHYRDEITPLAVIVEELKVLQDQGKIRFYGICNANTDDLSELLSCGGQFASVQNQYSLAFRDREAGFRKLTDILNATALTWGSLGQGILTGKYGPDAVFTGNDRRSRPAYTNFHGEKLQHNLRIVEVLKQIAAARSKPVSAVALRFILDQFPEGAALCGAKHPRQILSNAQALSWHLSKEELRALDEVSRSNT